MNDIFHVTKVKQKKLVFIHDNKPLILRDKQIAKQNKNMIRNTKQTDLW